MKVSRVLFAAALAILGAGPICAQSPSADYFAPLDSWRAAVVAGSRDQLRASYSVNPPARQVDLKGNTVGGADDDVRFWLEQKSKGLIGAEFEVAKSDSPQPGVRRVILQGRLNYLHAPKKLFVTCLQIWQQQGAGSRIVVAGQSELTRLEQPIALDPFLYPENADAKAEIKGATERAQQSHRHVLVVFGANWCYDCDVLDLAFRDSDTGPLVRRNFEVVHVDVGQFDKNLDLAKQYHVPIEKGIPALAVLDADGKLLYSQQAGEFERARSLAPEDIAAFIHKWGAGR